MRINLIESESSPELAELVLKEWLNGPVFLASTSQYRKHILAEVGFSAEKITAVQTSDEEEKVAMENYLLKVREMNAQGGGMDNYFTGGPLAAASAKVEALLAKVEVPNNALVIAADTVTHSYNFPENSPGIIWDASPSDKPQDIEAAAKNIKNKFNAIIIAYAFIRFQIHEALKVLDDTGKPEERKKQLAESLPQMQITSTPELKISVTTGVAIRFPGDTHISAFKEELDLFPTALFDLVDQELGDEYKILNDAGEEALLKILSRKIDQLIDEVLAVDPNLVTKVSGGIPFHEPQVRELLGIKIFDGFRLVSDQQVDEGIYKGMPANALKEYLKTQAANHIR